MQQKWIKLGRILKPKDNYIKSNNIGPSFIRRKSKNILEIYFTHRNQDNISKISKVDFDLNKKIILKNSFIKILSENNYGYFDQDGVGYPSLVTHKKRDYLFYVGWIRNNKKLVPFQNRIGICKLVKKAKRLFSTPIIGLSEFDKFNTGSCYIKKINSKYIIYYTSFSNYKKINNKYRHVYSIKYATSSNLIHWKKNKKFCIRLKKNEFAISKPSVIFYKKKYHMWFCTRGKYYKIGYAYSKNGINWIRDDKKFVVIGKKEKWDSLARAYPSVIKHDRKLLMVYTGNHYGKTGIGMLEMNL